MTVERPKESDPAIREKAIAELAIECAGWAEDKPENWIEPLRRCHFYRNGYELAQDLERYAYVSPDLELVEILDGASHYVWSAHREAVKAWVAENNIRPTLEVGTRVRCRYGEGFINGIHEDEAAYTVLKDEERDLPQYRHGGGTLVAYEAVEPITASGIEAPTGGETGNTDSTEGESPTAESGDAQNPPPKDKING